MKIEIANGRIIDPAQGIDRVASLYVAAGKVAGIGKAPEGWTREPRHRCQGAGRGARSHRPLGAPARAGLRIQGHAGIGDGSGHRGWRDQPRVPARHRPAARRAGPGGNAQAPRAPAEPGARLSDRRAYGAAAGNDADRNGRTRRGRMRGLFACRHAAGRHAGAAARDAVCVDVRLSRLASSQRHRTWAREASRTTAKSLRGSACRAYRRRPRPSRS